MTRTVLSAGGICTEASLATVLEGHGPSKTHVTVEQRRARPPRPAPLKEDQLLYIALGLLTGSIALASVGLALMLIPQDHRTHLTLIDSVLADKHYKYLVPLLIPAGLVTIIVNWGGLHYFRHA